MLGQSGVYFLAELTNEREIKNVKQKIRICFFAIISFQLEKRFKLNGSQITNTEGGIKFSSFYFDF